MKPPINYNISRIINITTSKSIEYFALQLCSFLGVYYWFYSFKSTSRHDVPTYPMPLLVISRHLWVTINCQLRSNIPLYATQFMLVARKMHYPTYSTVHLYAARNIGMGIKSSVTYRYFISDCVVLQYFIPGAWSHWYDILALRVVTPKIWI